MKTLDDLVSDLDEVDTDAEILRSVKRDLAVGLDADIGGASQNPLQNLMNDGLGARNIDVLSLLRRGIGKTCGATN